jgi:hypothetical protein
VSRAGAIALLLLASALSPVLPGASATALPDEAVPDSIVLPLAPDFQPAQPTATPTPGGETPGTPDADPDDSTEPGSEETPGEEPVTTDPLEVSITRLTPSTLPRRGVVSISGRITNRSEEPWTDLTVYAATSATPITTEEELAVAEEGPSGVEPADYQRLVDPDLYAQARDLDPGESTTYQVRIPRDQLGLPTDPGVYRVGVQVLGTEAGGRIEGADGRARVLMASVPPGQRTQVSLALQMRKRTVRTATGEVDSVPGWQRTLGREGRMRQVVRLLATAGDYPLSVLVDPAVVEAVGSLAEGNTGIDLAATTADGIDEDTGTIVDEPPPTSEPGSPAPNEGGDTEEPAPAAARTAADALSWLGELRAALDGRDVRSIPYGDLDLGAAVRHGGDDLVDRSLVGGISLLSDYGIQATGIGAPYQGLLGQPAADALPDGVPMLVSRRSFVSAIVKGDDAEVLDTRAGAVPAALTAAGGAPIWTFRSIRTSAGSAAGASGLEMRQRILARGGIQALTSPDEPLVVVLPPQWNPGTAWPRSDFFEGLRVRWLSPVSLNDLTPDEIPVVEGTPLLDDAEGEDAAPADPGADPGDPGVDLGDDPGVDETVVPDGEATSALALSYPARQLQAEVPRRVFRAARRLTSTGAVLGGVVAGSDAVGPRVERQAMLGLSFHTRGSAPGATGRLRAADTILEAMLRDIEVLAPRFVRMASANGSFLVPVVNGLDVPVRVQLRAEVTEPGLRLEVPDPVEVPALSRQPIRVAVVAETIGIRSVRVDLVTVDGERLYAGPTFSVRSSQVGQWVWVVMAVGSALLFVAIAVRIHRRVRTRRATHGPVLQRETLMRGDP